jgi:hypothetical protein
VAQPLGSLESGRPGTTLTALSNRGLTYEQPFCNTLVREDDGGEYKYYYFKKRKKL